MGMNPPIWDEDINNLEEPFRAKGSEGIHEGLACLLLRAFSRFEAALKEAGYCKPRGEALRVEYSRFGEEHEEAFAEARLPVSGKYLTEHPPKRQVKENGKVLWRPMAPPPNPVTLKWLLEAAYQVRNNLFHGGKWTPEVRDPSRDENLLRAALSVVRCAMDLDDEVRRKYRDVIV